VLSESDLVQLGTNVHRRTGKKIEDAPKMIKTGDAAMVKMLPSKPMVRSPRKFVNFFGDSQSRKYIHHSLFVSWSQQRKISSF
jgi:hypothetical protein